MFGVREYLYSWFGISLLVIGNEYYWVIGVVVIDFFGRMLVLEKIIVVFRLVVEVYDIWWFNVVSIVMVIVEYYLIIVSKCRYGKVIVVCFL